MMLHNAPLSGDVLARTIKMMKFNEMLNSTALGRPRGQNVWKGCIPKDHPCPICAASPTLWRRPRPESVEGLHLQRSSTSTFANSTALGRPRGQNVWKGCIPKDHPCPICAASPTLWRRPRPESVEGLHLQRCTCYVEACTYCIPWYIVSSGSLWACGFPPRLFIARGRFRCSVCRF